MYSVMFYYSARFIISLFRDNIAWPEERQKNVLEQNFIRIEISFLLSVGIPPPGMRLPDKVRKHFEIGAHGCRNLWKPYPGRRMIGDKIIASVALYQGSMGLTDFYRLTQQAKGSNTTTQDNDFRVNTLYLRQEPTVDAGCQLSDRRRSITGRPAFDATGYKNSITPDPVFRKQLLQKFTGWSYKRSAALILFSAGRFTDEHKTSPVIALTGNRMLPLFGQAAFPAVTDGGCQRIKSVFSPAQLQTPAIC